MNITSCAAGNGGKNGRFDSILKSEVFQSSREFSVAN